MTFTFRFAEKQAFAQLAPVLFDLLYANMSEIAPSGYCYEEDRAVWVEAVVPAMEKENRRVVLLHADGIPAGYFQYCVTDTSLMMEEFQVKRPYQGSGIFAALFAWLLPQLPKDLQVVEAYAHKRNEKSQGILEHLGLTRIGENKSGNSYLYHGPYAILWKSTAKGRQHEGRASNGPVSSLGEKKFFQKNLGKLQKSA